MYKGVSHYLQHHKKQTDPSPVGEPKRKKGYRSKDLQRIRVAHQSGEVLVGHVKSVQSHGAFIALGLIDGFVSRTEIAEHRVGDVTKRLRPGMSVRVVVIHVDGDGKGISLSMRQVPK